MSTVTEELIKREMSPFKIEIPDFLHPRKDHLPVSCEGNDAFKALVVSMRVNGTLIPILVEVENGKYVLAEIGHYYRLMAAREAGLKKVSVEIIPEK